MRSWDVERPFVVLDAAARAVEPKVVAELDAVVATAREVQAASACCPEPATDRLDGGGCRVAGDQAARGVDGGREQVELVAVAQRDARRVGVREVLPGPLLDHGDAGLG